jgi:nitroreductase
MADVLNLDPYEATQLPVAGLGDARLRELLAWAVLSPSPHNTQPWSWRVHDGVIDLRGDYSRLLAVSDPDGRELIISCGSALEHLLLRLGIEGDPVRVELLPDAADPHLFARVSVGEGAPYPHRPDLVEAMPMRRTNRTAYHGDPMDEGLRSRLDQACAEFDVTTHWIRDDASRASLVDLIMESDREQMKSADFRHELSHWMRPKGSHSEDGMEADLLGQTGVAAYVAPLVVRTFDIGKVQAAADSQLTEGSPDIVVLTSASDDAAGRLATGRALAHLVLTAMAEGRYSAYMNQPCEVPASRVRLAQLIGTDGHPQLVVRLGLADPVHRALRMPVAEVLAS